MLGRRNAAATVVVLALGAVLTSTSVAGADETTPSTTSTPTSTPTATTTGPASAAEEGEGDDGTLSPEELAKQLEEADALKAELDGSGSEIAAGSARLEQLAAQANTLLQRYATARDTEKQAREVAQRNVAQLEALVKQADEDRRSIGRWAYEAYSGGGSVAELGAILDSLAADPDDATDYLAQINYISEVRDATYDRSVENAEAQRVVAAKALEATKQAAQATKDASEAKDELEVITQQQQGQLTSLRSLHSQQVSRGAGLAGLLLGQGDDAATAASKELLESMRLPETRAAFVGEACDGDTQDYPNGQIPPSALCPLYKAVGESLRPAAAAAFDAMSKAYEKDTGSPICVTDSYRSYAEQVQVKGDRGSFAATPGYSEHGRGLALDLCGGINDFGSPAHLWMKQNAPLYGWFHPAWAQAGGSLPEPWHWEFAG